MRLVSFISSLLGSGILLSGFLLQTHASESRLVAEINGEKIYQSGIDIIVNDLQRAGTKIDNKMRDTLIERLIEQKLVAQYARKKAYHKREDVQKQIEVMTEMVLKDAYLSDLIKNTVTQDAIKSEFDRQMASYKPNFEYKASHILVNKEKIAKEIKAKLDSGEDFLKLAAEYSIDSNSKTGGDLGYFSKDMMVKPFSDTVTLLKLQEISNPIKTDFGWHIIKLFDKRELPKPTLEQLSQQIDVQLSRKIMSDHIKSLKNQSTIAIHKSK
jgi:peptidyl-prolyl cis-trans isomerase C